MPIKASCNCGFSFAVKDEFAGKRVKCPKCAQPVSIISTPVPQVPVAQQQAAAKKIDSPADRTKLEGTRVVRSGMTVGGSNSNLSLQSPPKVARDQKTNSPNGNFLKRGERSNPILDLLDDAGVKSVTTEPVCPKCAVVMSPTAIICVHCGFNRETGERLETFSDVKLQPGAPTTFIESDTDRLLAIAEKEIKAAPNSVLNQDFGDGSDSIVVAIGALLGFGLIIAAGVMTILVMDRMAQVVEPVQISFVSSTLIVALCMIYISYVAFRASVLHGVMCVLTIQYCVIFAFMQGRGLLVYGIIMQVSLIISAITGYIAFS